MGIKLIAEIGWNHVGDMDIAKRMIDAAKESGADYAKFQTWSVSRLRPGPWDTDGRREIYEKAELTPEKHEILYKHCQEVGIKFLTSIFDAHDIKMVRKFTNEVKIASTEIANEILLDKVTSTFDHVYVSLGASYPKEYIKHLDKPNITFMHCVSSYPCEYSDVNFNKFLWLKDKVKDATYQIGYSGHAIGIWDAIQAISLGATVVEKHFTIDHELPGRDNKFAILPNEFKMIREFSDKKDLMMIDRGLLPQKCEYNYLTNQKHRWSSK
jgi:sialic acid synthase SpsE